MTSMTSHEPQLRVTTQDNRNRPCLHGGLTWKVYGVKQTRRNTDTPSVTDDLALFSEEREWSKFDGATIFGGLRKRRCVTADWSASEYKQRAHC
jgi:hypothetical protein